MDRVSPMGWSPPRFFFSDILHSLPFAKPPLLSLKVFIPSLGSNLLISGWGVLFRITTSVLCFVIRLSFQKWVGEKRLSSSNALSRKKRAYIRYGLYFLKSMELSLMPAARYERKQGSKPSRIFIRSQSANPNGFFIRFLADWHPLHYPKNLNCQ